LDSSFEIKKRMPVVMVSDLCLYFFDKVGKIISDGSKN
jgi:hypothetical protein